MKSMFCLLAIILYIDFSSSIKLQGKQNSTSLEIFNQTLTKIIEISQSYEYQGRIYCEVKHCTSCENNKTNICNECDQGYQLHDNKCYNKKNFDSFIDSLKREIKNPDELKILEFAINPDFSKNKVNGFVDSSLNESDNSLNLKFESLQKKFSNSNEILKEIGRLNERECRMRINQFTIDFQKNMEVLLSLSNFFEQKTMYEIEKTKNSILEIISFEEGDPKTKLKMVQEKIDSISKMITDIFENIKKRINEYEDISYKKILRMKNSYRIFLKKFLE